MAASQAPVPAAAPPAGAGSRSHAAGGAAGGGGSNCSTDVSQPEQVLRGARDLPGGVRELLRQQLQQEQEQRTKQLVDSAWQVLE
jgi:hypothetical protein